MVSSDKFFVIAGPCVVESKELLIETASTMKEICNDLGIGFVFKSSYKKANRTSKDSFVGIGDEKALNFLGEIKEEFSVPVLTDVHTINEVELASKYVDVLQIPAFLSRQTELLAAAGNSGRFVNIKKGQFMAPENMKQAAEKTGVSDKSKVWLTERGATFGYHDLVVDFRSLVIMKQLGYPVIFDATHSVQKPSAGLESGGSPEFIPALARAAAAVGIDGLFIETHPMPEKALSDSASQLQLSKVKDFLKEVVAIRKAVQ